MRRALLAALVALAPAGCGGTDSGAHVRGTVTFKGEPVPHGRVYFDADQVTNPGGQQGYADIVAGRYDTAVKGKPPSAGPVLIRVEGLKPPAPDGTHTLLFQPHEFRAELPAGTSEKDIEVPASAGDRLPKNPGPRP